MKLTSLAHVSVLVATFIVATTFPIGALISPHMNPASIVFIRFLISVVTMLPIAIASSLITIPDRRRGLQLASIGIVHAVFFIMMFVALRYTSPLNSAVIYTLVPSISALMAFLLIGERINKLHSFLLPIGLMATIWVICRGNVDAIVSFDLNIGDAIFGGACILLGIYSTLLKKFHVPGKTLDLVFWSMAFGAIPLGIYFFMFSPSTDYLDVPFYVYGWIIYLAVLTVLTSFIWAYGSPLIGPMKTMAYSYLIPTFVLVIDGVLYNKWPDNAVIPGVLIGIICMIVIQLASTGRTAKSDVTLSSTTPENVGLSRK